MLKFTPMGRIPLHSWRINSATDRPQAAAQFFKCLLSSSFSRTVTGTFRTFFSDFLLPIFLILQSWISLFFGVNRGAGCPVDIRLAPTEAERRRPLSKSTFICGVDWDCGWNPMLAISVDTSTEQPFRVAGILPYFSLPSKKKILCPFHLRSGFGFSCFLDKWKSRYTAPRMTG